MSDFNEFDEFDGLDEYGEDVSRVDIDFEDSVFSFSNIFWITLKVFFAQFLIWLVFFIVFAFIIYFTIFNLILSIVPFAILGGAVQKSHTEDIKSFKKFINDSPWASSSTIDSDVYTIQDDIYALNEVVNRDQDQLELFTDLFKWNLTRYITDPLKYSVSKIRWEYYWPVNRIDIIFEFDV